MKSKGRKTRRRLISHVALTKLFGPFERLATGASSIPNDLGTRVIKIISKLSRVSEQEILEHPDDLLALPPLKFDAPGYVSLTDKLNAYLTDNHASPSITRTQLSAAGVKVRAVVQLVAACF